MRQINEFFPAGTQLKTPGAFSFRLADITAIEATGEPNGFINIFVSNSSQPIHLTFHRNVDGGPAEIYQIKERIEQAIKLEKEGQSAPGSGMFPKFYND